MWIGSENAPKRNFCRNAFTAPTDVKNMFKRLEPLSDSGRDRQCPYFTFMLSFILFRGQVHGSAYAHLSKCCFSTGTCWIVYASNMIMS